MSIATPSEAQPIYQPVPPPTPGMREDANEEMSNDIIHIEVEDSETQQSVQYGLSKSNVLRRIDEMNNVNYSPVSDERDVTISSTKDLGNGFFEIYLDVDGKSHYVKTVKDEETDPFYNNLLDENMLRIVECGEIIENPKSPDGRPLYPVNPDNSAPNTQKTPSGGMPPTIHP